MIVIIPCGAAKQSVPTIAGRMYTGTYHKACLRYALSIADTAHIYILSAKYGLLSLTTRIVPYNLKMGEVGSITSEKVREQAEVYNISDEIVIAIGGSRYIAVCKAVWHTCVTPLRGYTGMGFQIQALKANHGRLPTEWRK